MKRKIASKNAVRFWQEVSVAGGQVTFGVVAAVWFVGPYDIQKAAVLAINFCATLLFLSAGFKFSQKL